MLRSTKINTNKQLKIHHFPWKVVNFGLFWPPFCKNKRFFFVFSQKFAKFDLKLQKKMKTLTTIFMILKIDKFFFRCFFFSLLSPEMGFFFVLLLFLFFVSHFHFFPFRSFFSLGGKLPAFFPPFHPFLFCVLM